MEVVGIILHIQDIMLVVEEVDIMLQVYLHLVNIAIRNDITLIYYNFQFMERTNENYFMLPKFAMQGQGFNYLIFKLDITLHKPDTVHLILGTAMGKQIINISYGQLPRLKQQCVTRVIVDQIIMLLLSIALSDVSDR